MILPTFLLHLVLDVLLLVPVTGTGMMVPTRTAMMVTAVIVDAASTVAITAVTGIAADGSK